MDNKLTDTSLEQLATLSKLNLSDSTKEDMRRDLSQLLAYVDKLNELNTENLPPLTHFSECILPFHDGSSVSGLRKDLPSPSPAPEQLVSLAPKHADSYYIVPNTLSN